MTIEIKVPTLPESVTDATVAKWYKKEGDTIQRNENLVDLETDKVMLEVPAPKSGVIKNIMVAEGDTVTTDQILAALEEGVVSEEPSNADTAANESTSQDSGQTSAQAQAANTAQSGPAARRVAQENDVDLASVAGSGKSGRVTKQDVLQHAASPGVGVGGHRTEERVPMSRLRQRIAERLLDAQSQAAMLTSFNEINMKPVMDLRKKYKDAFEKKHGVRLGFMSFFTKAVVEALKQFPTVNASIDGTDLIYHNYFDIGIAIGSPRGLVVPILRNAENMGMADVEKQIREYAERAKTGKVTIDEMTGGTFTITNGGTFGSMLSTPILNPPQSAILGMHNIVERPVVENGEIVVRPIMYVALTYDHRVIDGRESVQFLVSIKNMLEDPARLLLDI